MAALVESLWRGITYRGREGHWAWMMHRVCGLGILLFLFLHVFDIYLMNLGKETFSKFLFLYSGPPFKIMEVFLIFGVIYHAINGLRVIIVDFWPSSTKYQRLMYRIALVVVLLIFVPAAVVTLSTLFTPA